MPVTREWMTLNRDHSFAESKIVVDFMVAWNDVDAVLAEMFDNPFNVGGHVGYLGEQFPGKSTYRADSVSVAPLGGADAKIETDPATGVCTFQKAVITATYVRLPYTDEEENQPPDQEPISTTRYTVGAEFLTLPNSGLYFDGGNVSDPVPDDLQAGILIPTIEWEVTFHRLSSIPIDKIRDKIGHVNQSRFKGADAETLLFLGADINYSFTPSEEIVYQLSYRFSERRITDGIQQVHGWNHFLDPRDNNKWKKLLRKDNSRPIYRSTGFTDLFKLNESP